MAQEIKKIEFSDRVFILTAVLIAGVVIYFAGQMMYQYSSLPQNYPQEITVTGEDKVYVKPDIAKVDLGVKTEEKTSQDAVNKNNEITNRIIKAVKDLGVDEKDIQTTSYNLSAVYDYTERGRNFVGYSLNQQITVKIRNFDIVGDVLDRATAEGANSIGDLQFTIEDPEKAQADARAKAIENAKEKALVLTQQAGLKIVKLSNISEGYSTPSTNIMYAKGMGSASVDSESVAPSVQSGQLEVTSTVYLTYRVK